MSYTPTLWTNGETPINDENLNHIENGISDVSAKLGDNTLEYRSDGKFYITSPDGTTTKKLGSSEGDATVAQVLEGATFNSANTSDDEDYSIGTMPDMTSTGSTTLSDIDKRDVIILNNDEYGGDMCWRTVNKDGVTRICLKPAKGYYNGNEIVANKAVYDYAYNDATPADASVDKAGNITVTRADNTQWTGKKTSNSYNNGWSGALSSARINIGVSTMHHAYSGGTVTSWTLNFTGLDTSHSYVISFASVAASSHVHTITGSTGMYKIDAAGQVNDGINAWHVCNTLVRFAPSSSSCSISISTNGVEACMVALNSIITGGI